MTSAHYYFIPRPDDLIAMLFKCFAVRFFFSSPVVTAIAIDVVDGDGVEFD